MVGISIRGDFESGDQMCVGIYADRPRTLVGDPAPVPARARDSARCQMMTLPARKSEHSPMAQAAADVLSPIDKLPVMAKTKFNMQERGR